MCVLNYTKDDWGLYRPGTGTVELDPVFMFRFPGPLLKTKGPPPNHKSGKVGYPMAINLQYFRRKKQKNRNNQHVLTAPAPRPPDFSTQL